MKGNPSVIPGYDLTSQPATITMITSSECMQIWSTDTFLNSYWLREMKWIIGLGLKKRVFVLWGQEARILWAGSGYSVQDQ